MPPIHYTHIVYVNGEEIISTDDHHEAELAYKLIKQNAAPGVKTMKLRCIGRYAGKLMCDCIEQEDNLCE